MRALCLALVAIAFALSTAPSEAQATATAPKRPPLFPQLFPSPSHLNGYEELVLAGDLARDNPSICKLDEPGTTLSTKRAVIGSREGVRLLDLVRQGLSKAVETPRTSDELGFEVFASIRVLARLLAHDQYVCCADGRVSEAMDALRMGLRLGYIAQSQQMIGGLVGIAVDAISMKAMRDRVDQWSQRDCERMIALARDWMRLPDPAIAALASERAGALARLKDLPNGTPAMLAYAEARFDRAIAELRKPPWLRRIDTAHDGSPEAQAFAAFETDRMIGQALVRFAAEQAMMQMLATEAGIRAYRWENNRLPGALDELKLGDLIVDPYAGKPFTYRVIDDRRYTLSSAGLDVNWQMLKKEEAGG